MEGQELLQFLSDYGYWIMVPLMAIEGPVVTILASFMATLGMFNIVVVFVLSVFGDMLGDVLWYWAGRLWGMRFVQHVGRHVGVTEELVLKMEKFFNNHGGKTIFAVKSTTGLCWATFVAAGIVKMNFGRFLAASFLGGIFWSAFLVAMGYFFGEFYQEIAQKIKYAGWIIFGLAAATFVGVNVYKKKRSQKLIDANEKNYE